MGIRGLRTHRKTREEGLKSGLANAFCASKNTCKTGGFRRNGPRQQTFQYRSKACPADPRKPIRASLKKVTRVVLPARGFAPRMLPTRVNTLGENSPSLHGTAAQITRSSRCIPGFEAYSARSTPSSRSCRRRWRVNFFRRSLGMNRTGILGARKAAGPGTHLLPQTFSSPRREAAVERRISR